MRFSVLSLRITIPKFDQSQNAENYLKCIETLGEIGNMGHVDICVNGGRVQPFCENRENYQLCSHVWAVCFMAQSIDGGNNLYAESCSRRCPTGMRLGHKSGQLLLMGQHTPTGSRGSFCLTSRDPPHCPKYNNGHGDNRCCL